MSLPNTGAFGTGETGDLTAAEAAALHEQVLAASKQHAGAMAASELTISSGSITPTRWCHSVDTEGDAGADDLVKILTTGLDDGALLLLVPENTARVVTVKSQVIGVGQIVLADGVDFVMDAEYKQLLLRRSGNLWREVLRVTYPPSGAPHGRQVFTASGTFTASVSGYHFITMIGGGGGGGGGAGSNNDNPNTGTNGGNGGNGGNTTFGSIVAAGGGAGGGGGNKNGAGGGYSPGLSLPGSRAILNDAGLYQSDGGPPLATPINADGRGGYGGDGGSGDTKGGGAGSSGNMGSYLFRYPASLAKGQEITVTIGAGGTAGTAGTGTANGSAGEVGADGVVIVEW